jgi:hypothetical protein
MRIAPKVKATGQKSPRWAVWQRFEIPDRNEPDRVYLRRLRIVQTPWFGVYLHHIFLPDNDRDPHDHPWPFASFVLRGGYTERVWRNPNRRRDEETDALAVTKTHRRWSLHRVSTDVAHQIVQVAPGLKTLVFVGPRVRQWGFWTEQGFVAWTEYDQAGLGPDPFDS